MADAFFRLASMFLRGVLAGGLLLLSIHMAAAQASKAVPPPPSRPLPTIELYRTPISELPQTLSLWTDVPIVVDQAVTGRVIVWVRAKPEETFYAVLKNILAHADQPLDCSLRGGAYHIGIMPDHSHWEPPYWVRAEQHARLAELRDHLSVSPQEGTSDYRVDASGRSLPRLIFGRSTSSGPGSGLPLIGGGPNIFSGSVVIIPLVPVTSVSVTPGGDVPLAEGRQDREAVFQSHPAAFAVHVLFDTVGATMKARRDETVWTDRQGREVIIYTKTQYPGLHFIGAKRMSTGLWHQRIVSDPVSLISQGANR